jgi:hypothetical protein
MRACLEEKCRLTQIFMAVVTADKRIASWLSLANAFRADSSGSLFAISWTDKDTGLVRAEAARRWQGPVRTEKLAHFTPLGLSKSGLPFSIVKRHSQPARPVLWVIFPAEYGRFISSRR